MHDECDAASADCIQDVLLGADAVYVGDPAEIFAHVQLLKENGCLDIVGRPEALGIQPDLPDARRRIRFQDAAEPVRELRRPFFGGPGMDSVEPRDARTV